MVKKETMRPPCDSKTPGFDQLPFSSEESQRVMFVNKPRDDNHTKKFCKTNDVPIMDETMRLSSKSLSKPQEESSRASQTREGNTVYSVEERNDLTFMNKGLNDNSVNFAVVTIDTVGGMLDHSANTSSQCNISSAEGKEPNSDNNYGQDANVSSSLENHSFIYGKMDNSSSLDTISKNSSHLCIQPPTNVRIDHEPNEDTIERPDPVEGSQMNEADIVEDIYTDYSTAESDENSTNFALDDNDTVGSRLDESANACSEGNNFSPEITGLDNDNSHANGNPSSQMLKSHTSMGDKMCNDFLLDAGLKESSPSSSWPHANVTVDNGPHEDTLGLENNVADNSSVLGTFGMDKTKGKKHSQDENRPTISKADEEQNVVISKLDNYASAGSRGNPISEEDTELDKTTCERDIGIFSSQDEINISRASKTEEQNVLSTYHDSIVLEKDRAASSSQGSNGNLMNTSSSQVLKSCTPMVDKTDTSSSLSTRSKQPYPNVTVDSGLHEDTLERQKTGVTGLENNVADNSSVLGTFGMDKTKGKKYSHESQDENNGPTISESDKEQNGLFVSQNAKVNENKYIATSSHEDDNPTTSGFINYDAVISKLDNCARSRDNPISEEESELHKTTYERDVGICSSQAENNISRASKTEEQNVLSTDCDSIVIEKESAASSSQGSNGNSINWIVLDDNYTVGVRLDNSANTSSQDDISSAEGKEVESGGNCERGMDTSSRQMQKSCTSMVDKTDTSSSLNTRSKQPYPNVTVDSGLHEDTLELQKPGITGLENNVGDDSSMLGTFGIDKTKKYSQDENNEPTISKADEEQNGLFVSENAEVNENKYIATSNHEGNNPTNSGFIDYDAVISKLDNCASAGSRGNPISEEDTELDNTTCERDIGIWSSQAENNISRASKTEEQNVLSTDHDSIVIEKESAASSSQGSNGNSINWTGLHDNYTVGSRLDNSANTSIQDNIKEVESGGKCERGMDTSSSQTLKICTSMVDKTDTSSCLNTQSKQPYPNVTVNSELHENSWKRQKLYVRGREFHPKDKALILLTSENYNNKNENLSSESQGDMVPISLKTEEEKKLDKTNDKNISYRSQDKEGPRGFKTKEEQCELNTGLDITKTKHIDYSKHASEDDSANFSDAVIGRLDNSTNEGRRANTSSSGDTKLDKKNSHGREIKIQSNQELLNPTSMGDKMASNCPLDTRPNKSILFSNKSYASAIEDSELHEDTIEEQKPVVRDSESLVEDKTFTDLELAHGISSDNKPEYQVPKINNNNTDTFLGNEVDFKASETQTLDNSTFVGNQFNRFPSSGTLHMVAANVLKSSKNQKKSSKSQITDGAKRQSHLKPETKTKRQKSPKLVQNSKSNIQDKSKRVLQPKRGEKAFNESNREKRTPIAYTPKNGARTLKANSYKEKKIVTRMNQSMESIRLMIFENLKGSWAAVVKWLVLLWLFHHCVIPVRATPIQPTPELPLTQWRRHTFCTDGYSLINETLIINNMEQTTNPGCMFRAPAVPYFYNCSKFNALVFFINATCLEMFTTYLQTESWGLEYGAVYHGRGVTSVRGELFPNEHVMGKVHQYEGGDGPQGRSYIQATPTPLFTNGTTSEPLDRPTWSRISCLLPIIAVTLLVLVLLGYYFLKRCKNKLKTPSPTSNGIELQVNKQDGDDTNRGLLSNGTSEPPTQEPDG